MPTPNFFIVGAPRCGTTSMYQYLRQHPDIVMPVTRRKEPHYLLTDITFQRSVTDYETYLGLFEGGEHARRIGEASAWYLYSTEVPQQIKRMARGPKLIIMLRSPLDLVISLHNINLYHGNEDIHSLEEAIAAEPDRAQGRRMPPKFKDAIKFQYRWHGLFSSHVQRYIDTFGEENVKVIRMDEFRNHTERVYQQTLSFLNVDTSFRPEFLAYNASNSYQIKKMVRDMPVVGRFAKHYVPVKWRHKLSNLLSPKRSGSSSRDISDRLRDDLMAYFDMDIQCLEHLLDWDLSDWRGATIRHR